VAQFVIGPNVNPAFKCAQKTVELLESITPVDMAQSVPYIRMVRVDPKTRAPAPNAKPLNIFFKPPEFGGSVEGAVNRERPAVSLESLSVITKQNYGTIMEEHIEISIKAHRIDAIFFGSDSGWSDLLTPGNQHQIEYGWTGASKNGLINGEGFFDETTHATIPSKRSILCTTSYYTFNFNEKGEVDLKIKAYNTAGYAIRDMLVGHEFFPEVLDPDATGFVPIRDSISKETAANVLKNIQTRLKTLEAQGTPKKGVGMMVRLVDVVNVLIAPTITQVATRWGYSEPQLLVGNFNRNCGSTRERFGAKSMADRSIGEFTVPMEMVTSMVNQAFSSGIELTVYNFLSNLFGICNRSDVWEFGKAKKGDGSLKIQKPNVKIRVSERQINDRKVLSVAVVDQFAEVKRFDPSDALAPEQQSREKIKQIVLGREVPFITFGKGFSFLKNCDFEAVMDPQIARNKITAAAGAARSRAEYVQKTGAAFRQGLPDAYHEIFASAVEGDLTMIGNFAFDTFSLIWLDFRVPIWDGPYTVTERQDTVGKAGFETRIHVFYEGNDPLNVRRRLTADELQKKTQGA
jgi:hypothetical protein